MQLFSELFIEYFKLFNLELIFWKFFKNDDDDLKCNNFDSVRGRSIDHVTGGGIFWFSVSQMAHQRPGTSVISIQKIACQNQVPTMNALSLNFA